MPPSPSGKRPLQENSEETQLKKKKRESLLSFARNSFEVRKILLHAVTFEVCCRAAI